ncbi:MAG TPA: hypothetical protein VMT62_05220 [Syntrophorhabdaceae bacterium]|nr:hypothetical protein [Syntrophorhabdaceae bacterium]
MPFWFKMAMVWFILLLLTGFLRRKSMPKAIGFIQALSKDKTDKFLGRYSLVVTCEKIRLFIFPLAACISLYSLYLSASGYFVYSAITFVLVYLFLLNDFTYRRGMMSKIRAEEHHSEDSGA